MALNRVLMARAVCNKRSGLLDMASALEVGWHLVPVEVFWAGCCLGKPWVVVTVAGMTVAEMAVETLAVEMGVVVMGVVVTSRSHCVVASNAIP